METTLKCAVRKKIDLFDILKGIGGECMTTLEKDIRHKIRKQKYEEAALTFVANVDNNYTAKGVKMVIIDDYYTGGINAEHVVKFIEAVENKLKNNSRIKNVQICTRVAKEIEQSLIRSTDEVRISSLNSVQK